MVEGEGGGGGWGSEGVGERRKDAGTDEWEEFHSFGDVISSQGEINRLQLELTKVRLESKHWKALAVEKVSLNCHFQIS